MISYSRVTQNLSLLPDYIVQYETELEVAKKECSIHGIVEKNLTSLPGITEQRFNQLQEIEAVLNYLNIQLKRVRKEQFQKFLEGYARALTSRDAEKYADGTEEVINMELLINELSLLRNKYLGILKALESKNFMLGHITRLRAAGLEDIKV